MRKVFVTGIGAVTPVGHGRCGLISGLRENHPGVRAVSRFDAAHLHCRVAAEVADRNWQRWIPQDRIQSLDRYSRFALASALMAVADAHLSTDRIEPDRTGVTLGSALGGAGFSELQYRAYHERGLNAVDRSLAFSTPISAGVTEIARSLKLRGFCAGNADSCASGTVAVGRALREIQSGRADVMIAGAAEAPLTPLVFGAFDLIRAMSTRYNETPERASRPFDHDRDGFVMGEGAAMLVLEAEDHVRARGGPIIAELNGYALTNDGRHMTSPRPDGASAARAMSLALVDARIQPEQIDVISAHASGTPLNDPIETVAIKQALGDRAYQIPVIGTKSRHGHSLGAAAAIEIAAFALCLQERWIPGAMNLDNPDPACDLDCGAAGPRTGEFQHLLSNSFGFGGINACVVLSRVENS